MINCIAQLKALTEPCGRAHCFLMPIPGKTPYVSLFGIKDATYLSNFRDHLPEDSDPHSAEFGNVSLG